MCAGFDALQGALAALYRATRLGRLCQAAEDELGLLFVFCEVRLCLWEGMYTGVDGDSDRTAASTAAAVRRWIPNRSKAERWISAICAFVSRQPPAASVRRAHLLVVDGCRQRQA